MDRRKRLVVSIACAVLAMLLSSLHASHVRGQADRERTEALRRYGGDVVGLVVASRTMEVGDVVMSSDVSLEDWVASLAPDDALLSLDDVLGREVTVPVGAGVPLTKLNFRDSDRLPDVPKGHVAVSVPITERLGVATGIAQGARLVAYRVTDGDAVLVAREATVLSSPAAAEGYAVRGTLTIAVPSSDVSPVLAASTAGELRLVVPADDVRPMGGASQDATDVGPQTGNGEDAALGAAAQGTVADGEV